MVEMVAIVGPTAVGKSTLAMSLAQEIGGEIVNSDSLQVYRGLDIGTAKPSKRDRESIVHHLIDILEPQERYSAGEFCRRAEVSLSQIRERDRFPILVGGSGLYLRALIEGLAAIPPVPLAVRQELRSRLEAEGLASLHSELRHRDPEAAQRLSPGDTQRIMRALEIVLATGRTQTDWWESQRSERSERPSRRVHRVALTVPRSILYDRIEARVHLMIELGWVAEVEELLAGGVAPADPAFQAIGYRQLSEYIMGETTLAEAIEETVRATRRYAKRQETWFKQEAGVGTLHADGSEGSLTALLHQLTSV